MAKLKKMFLRTNSANLTKLLVEIFEDLCNSNLFFNAKTLSLCVMVGYKQATSAVNRIEPSGTFSILFILSIKSADSRVYDQGCFTW